MKLPTVRMEDVGVFQDENRHSAIQVAIKNNRAYFVPMSVIQLELVSKSLDVFSRQYKPLPTYAPQRAAAKYLSPQNGVATPITPEAAAYLRVIAGPAFVRERLTDVDISPETILKDHNIMATEKKTPAKRAAPATGKAETPNEGKKTKKTAAVETESAGRRGRLPTYGDDAKIKLLVKENPKKAGAAERFALYKNGMTLGEYFAAGGKRADINWDVKMQFIEVK